MLIHDSLRDEFRAEELDKHFTLGSLYSHTGMVVNNWNTLVPKHMQIIRGNKNISFRKCGKCLRNVYFAQGDRYVTNVRIDEVIFGTDLSGILLEKSRFSEFRSSKWPKLSIEKVSERNSPTDGYGPFEFWDMAP